jgi:hypothetical protein
MIYNSGQNTFRNSKKKTLSWHELAPKTQTERQELLRLCGPDAFVQPDKLKYPVMASPKKGTSPCTLSPKGIRAARQRVHQWTLEGSRERKEFDQRLDQFEKIISHSHTPPRPIKRTRKVTRSPKTKKAH